MGQILRNWRIIAATAFSAVLLIGAYALARGFDTPNVAQASTETALLQAIATKDSTGDGLPDWEKSLYGIPIDATTTDYFHLGMTDGEAVAKGLIVPKAIADIPASATTTASSADVVDPSLPPAPAEGTLTDAFAKNFFTLYINAKEAKGGDLSADDTNAIAQQALASLAQAVTLAPDFKSLSGLAVSGSGSDALKAFAISAEAISAKNKADAVKSEIFYLQDAVQNNDPTALAHIASIAKSYRDTAVGMAALAVPAELAPTDLALVNALMRLSQITEDFTSVNADPLATMLAIQQYPDAILALGNAFISVSNIYKTAGIIIPAGAPGASFVNLIADVAADQKAGANTQP